MNTVKKIVLIGSGEIGSRHLQALAKLPLKIHVNIVEPDDLKFNKAIRRLKDIKIIEDKFTYTHHNDLSNLEGKEDLVIVSTNSDIRTTIVLELLKKGYKRFILEKMVCQSEKDYRKLLEIISSTKSKAWVNSSRVYIKSYKILKNYFKNSNPLHFSVNRGNQGLGSNAFHFFILFGFFCDNYKLNINADYLDKEILSNKRGKKFCEFSGTLIGRNSNGSTITITFSKHEKIPLTINIIGKNKHIIIEEESEKIHFLKGIGKNKIKFNNELQSSLTTKIVKDILKKDYCELPTIMESSFIHYELFKKFNLHLKRYSKKQFHLCPIT